MRLSWKCYSSVCFRECWHNLSTFIYRKNHQTFYRFIRTGSGIGTVHFTLETFKQFAANSRLCFSQDMLAQIGRKSLPLVFIIDTGKNVSQTIRCISCCAVPTLPACHLHSGWTTTEWRSTASVGWPTVSLLPAGLLSSSGCWLSPRCALSSVRITTGTVCPVKFSVNEYLVPVPVMNKHFRQKSDQFTRTYRKKSFKIIWKNSHGDFKF